VRIVRPDLPFGAAVVIERVRPKLPAGRSRHAHALVGAIHNYETRTPTHPPQRRLTHASAIADTLPVVDRYALVATCRQPWMHLADATSLLEEGAVRLTYARSSLLNLRDTIVQEVAGRLRTRLGTTVRLREWQAGTRSPRAWELRQQAQELIELEAELPRRPE